MLEHVVIDLVVDKIHKQIISFYLNFFQEEDVFLFDQILFILFEKKKLKQYLFLSLSSTYNILRSILSYSLRF